MEMGVVRGRGRPHDSRSGDRRYTIGRPYKLVQLQCPEGLSSLLLVENRIDTTNTARMTDTTTKGEEMCMAQDSLLISE